MPVALTKDNVRIAYESYGNGPLTVMLLHGWGGSARFWEDMVSHLDLNGLRVIAISYRGYGDSDKPDIRYTLDHLAQDVLAVADAAGAKSSVLVGFSLGGKVAQYVAAVHPERVSGLVLIAPVPASEFAPPTEMIKAWCDAQSDPRAAYTVIVAPNSKVPIRPELLEAFYKEFVKARRGALEETLRVLGVSCADATTRVRAPSLAIAGTYDPLVPPKLLRKTLLTHITGARMITLPCGHMIPQEMPEQTAALVEAFLSGLGKTAATEAAA